MRRNYVNSILKEMFRAAFFTSLVSEFTQILALLIDGIIVCRFLGQDDIAAVGLAGPFFFIVGIPANGISAGLQTVCARELGRGRISWVNRVFSGTLIVTTAAMTLVTILTFLTVPQMAVLFGARGNASGLLQFSKDYLYGLGFEILPFVLLSVMTPVIIMDNGGTTAAVSSVCGCVTNVALDLVAVRTRSGLFGVGLASSAAAVVSLLVLLTHFLKKDRIIRFCPVRLPWNEYREVLILGAPKAAHALANSFRSGILNSLVIATGGSVAMSVLTIQGMIMDLTEIPAAGLSGAVGILAGVSYGEFNGDELKETGILAHRYIAVISAALMAALLLLSRPIARFYLRMDTDGISLLLFVIVCIALGTPFSYLVYTRVSYLQAIERVREAQIIELGANLILLLGAAIALSVPFGVYGVFAAFPVSKLLMLLVIWIAHVLRKKQLRLHAEDYLYLDARFLPSVWDVIAYPFESIEDCILASEQVGLFCKGHAMGSRTAYLAALCTEEIATNIIEHGIRQRRNRGAAEIRVTVSDKSLIIRVRDNGPTFNMGNLAKMLVSQDDPCKNIGLKILCGTAKDISYYRIYGMNTTRISVFAQE